MELAKLTRLALKDLGLDAKSMDRCKNFFALGMCYWLYNRTMDATYKWLDDKFRTKPVLAEANKQAMKAGYSYCEATEAFQTSYEIPPARLSPGSTGTSAATRALALGFVAASQRSGLTLFQGSYPITPASDILHELSMYKDFGVITFQAEDEIAAMTSAIGAAYAGCACDHDHVGPGHGAQDGGHRPRDRDRAAVVICNIQRGGPSTGLPTKTEQADLFQALFGRNSEAPVPVLAAATPGDCFWIALEASRIALKYMVPVIVLSDGYLANGAEPWKIPTLEELPEFPVTLPHRPRGLHALPPRSRRRWPAPGRSRARPASSTASAASRRRTAAATSTTSP